MFGFVRELLRQLFERATVDTPAQLRIQFRQGAEDRLDRGVFFECLRSQPAKVFGFPSWFAEVGVDDFFLGEPISPGQLGKSLDVNIAYNRASLQMITDPALE